MLIGTIIGAFFGGAAIPGFWAGVAFAASVGEGLLAGLVAVEGSIILKGVADLAIGNDTQQQDEADYDKIAGSTLTLAITGAMMLIGEIAAKLAKSIWEGASSLLRGEKAPEVDVKVGAPESKGTAPDKAAEPETPGSDTAPPELVDGERVVGEADEGHVKVTESGRCLICTTCEEIGIKYDAELKGDSPEIEGIKTELEEAKKMPNGEEKAKAIENVKEKLDKVREEVRKGETPEMKAEELKKVKADSFDAIERVKAKLKKLGDEISKAKAEGKATEAKAMERNKAEIETELRGIEDEWKRANEGAKDLADPDLQDLAREEFDDVRTKAEQLDGKAQDTLPKAGEELAYVRENRPALDGETVLGSDQFTHREKVPWQEIYLDAEVSNTMDNLTTARH